MVVVGSGLAGLSCARSLARAGLDAVVASPGQPGRDGASNRVHALAPWILLTAPWVRGDSPARYLADLQARGAGLERPGLAEVLAESSHEAAAELVDVLELVRLDDAPVLLPGDTVARGLRCHPRRDRPLLAPLLRHCRDAGVTLAPRTLVVGLEVAGAVTGVRVLSLAGTPRLESWRADAVVLACGGAGAVFPLSTSPRWCRGSGVALAGLGGALMHRPWLTQALPVTTTPPLYFPSSDAVVGSRLLVDGEPIPAAVDLTDATERIAAASRDGRTVEIDVSGSVPVRLPQRLKDSPALHRHGRLPMGVALHHSTGGIAVDDRGRTSVPRLYACGEAAGGVQGARRTMGTGLLEAYVFGTRAGKAVAHDLESAPSADTGATLRTVAAPLAPREFERALDRLLAPLVHRRPNGEVRDALREIGRWAVQDLVTEPEAALAGLRREAALVLLGSDAEERREEGE